MTPRCGQAISQHATSGAGADDDVIELRFGHASVLFPHHDGGAYRSAFE